MSSAYGSGAWWNDRLTVAIERASPAFERWTRRYLQDGEAIGYAMPEWKDLEEMDALKALEMVTGMIRVPSTSARGVQFLRKIVAEKFSQEANGA